MLHGRGASAADILSLSGELPALPVSFFAPQAANNTWYPKPFLAPLVNNEPWLGSALQRIDKIVEQVLAAGIPYERIILLGFSQGACLALEYAVRHPRRYAGVIGLSGGLIGPPGTRWETPGSFEQTPVFLGCSDVDPHIPLARVNESAKVFANKQASVDLRIYPNMGHAVNRDELIAVEHILRASAG